MSNVLYPVGLISQLDIERDDRTLIDEFDSGATAARAYWAAQNFKRKFTVSHAPLKPAEFKYLKSFFSQRGGQFDSFYFRDNITRGGNALVRFASPLKDTRAGQVIAVKTDLEEVAPIRALPEFDELTTAAGLAPLLWYDANREFYLQHCGAVILDPNNQTWDVMGNARAAWQSSTLNLGGSLAQYQTYNFTGAEWAKTGNIALIGTQPACTLFAIARHSTAASQQVLFSIGAKSSGAALGIQLNASNKYAPYLGGSETWTNTLSTNPGNTYQSLAAVFTGSANSEKLYVNAALIGTDTNTRSLTAGPFALGAAPDGSLIANPSNALTNANLAHVLVFAGTLTVAQIKAVHNLLGYQFGLSIVP